jgi:TolB-like protein
VSNKHDPLPRPRAARGAPLKNRFILAFILIFGACGEFPAPSSARSISNPISSDNPAVIAVTPFTNLTGQKEYDWLSTGIGEVFTTKLGSLPCFNLVERIKISEALKEMELGQTGLIDENTAPQVGKMVGAEGLVTGSFQIVGQAIRIDARLLDVETGRVYAFAGAFGELDKIFEAQDRIAASFLDALNAPLTDQDRLILASKPTTSMEAFKLYSQAVDTYTLEGSTLDDDQRIALLNQSTQIDPNFAMAYAGLGYIYAVKRQDYRQAVVNYNRVVILQPYNPAPRIWLTRIYTKEGNTSAAMQEQKWIDDLKRRPPSGSPGGQTGVRPPRPGIPALAQPGERRMQAPRSPWPARVQPPSDTLRIIPPPSHYYFPSQRAPSTGRAPGGGKGGRR